MPAIVSVVTPSYNRASHLPQLWRSLRDQAVDFEWLVVDDCGQDNTVEVLAGLDDSRIRCVRLDQNRGTSGARNVGIAEARGRYLVFIDDDDEFLPGVLPKMVECIAGSPTGVAVVGFPEIAGDTGKVVASVADHEIFDEAGVVCGDALNGAMNFIYRTAGIRGIPFDETLRTMGDRVWLNMLSRIHRVMTINMPTVKYNRHPNSIMGAESMVRNSALVARAHERTLANHADVLARCPRKVTHHLQAALYRYGVAGDRRMAWNVYLRLLKHSLRPMDAARSTGILLLAWSGLAPRVDTRRTRHLIERFGRQV